MNHTAHRTFCDASMSMTMYMDGFRAPLWAYLFHHQPASAAPPPCLNFLLRSWTLDTPLKFGAAMATVLMLGIGVEALAAARSGGALQSYLRRHRRRHPPRSVTCRLTPRQRKWILQSAVVVGSHVLQALCGYALMLAAMSYSVELLGSALIGLGIGYALCFEVDSPGGWADGEEIDIGGGGDGGDAEDDTNDEDDHEERDLEVDRHRGARATTPRSSEPGAGTQCCTGGGGGRGPPRRAFRFRSPVPTLGGGVRSPDRRRRQSGGNNHNGDGNGVGDAHPPGFVQVSQEEGADADYLRLQEDDRMTPLL